MSQVFQVLQCFNCETFQVQQIKKVPKWSCKICGLGQSIKKVYGTGTGKECRLLVQTNNMKRSSIVDVSPPKCRSFIANQIEPCTDEKSKWLPYIQDSDSDNDTLGDNIRANVGYKKADNPRKRLKISQTEIMQSNQENGVIECTHEEQSVDHINYPTIFNTYSDVEFD